jgi:hypothetical protein
MSKGVCPVVGSKHVESFGKCIFCGADMKLERAYAGASKAAGRKPKAVYAGWSCPEGPEEFVHYLVDNGEQVPYKTFARNVDVKTSPLDRESIKMLPTDWHVTYLKTKLPSGQLAWVMQHSHIEHLYLPVGVELDLGAEVEIIRGAEE